MLNYYGLSNIVPVKLDSYVCDLNLDISSDGYSCTPQSNKGFSYMWGGTKANFGVRTGKACFEVKILDNCEISDTDQDAPFVVRLGWSVDRATLQLGEDVCSFGYGGTAMISYNRKFTSYGDRFAKGDVVGCYLSVQDGFIFMAYKVNNKFLGNAFKMRWPSEEPLFPHILTKNCKIEVNFGQMSFPYFGTEEGFQLIAHMSPDALVPSITPPTSQRDCEVIMLVGLPGVGKTTWAMNYAKKFPEKNYFVLGTDSIIEKMRVKGLPRKNNFHGRFEVLIKQATECFNVNLIKAASKASNLILDQTNVYATARKRKVAQYRQKGFRVNCVVLVPEDSEMERRSKVRTKEQGKEVPMSALLDMKANFTLPQEDEQLFDQITFLELQRSEAQVLVEQYNREAASQGHTCKAVRKQPSAATNQYYSSAQKSYDTPQQASARYPNQSGGQARGDFYTEPKQAASYDPYSQQMQRAPTSAQGQSAHGGGYQGEKTFQTSNPDHAGAYNNRNSSSSAAADDYSMINSQSSANASNYADPNSGSGQYDGYNQQQKYMNRGPPSEAQNQFGQGAIGAERTSSDPSQRRMGNYQSTHPYPPATNSSNANTYQGGAAGGQQRGDWQNSQTATATAGGNGGAGYNAAAAAAPQSKADYWSGNAGAYDGSKPNQFEQGQGRGYTEGPGRPGATSDTWNHSVDGQVRHGGNIPAENRSHPYPQQQGGQDAHNFQGRPPPSNAQQFPTERRGFAQQGAEARGYDDYKEQHDGRLESEGMQDRRQVEPMDIDDRYSTSSQRSVPSTSDHRPTGQDHGKYDEHFGHQAATSTPSTYDRQQPEVANTKVHQAYGQFDHQDNLEGFDRGDGRYNTNSSKYNSYSEQGRPASFRQDYGEPNQSNSERPSASTMQDRNLYHGQPGQEPIARGGERGHANAFAAQSEFDQQQRESFPQDEFGQQSALGPEDEFGSQGARGSRGEFGALNNRGPRPPFNPANIRGPRPPFNPANSHGPQGQFGAPSERGPRPPFGSTNERGQRPPFGSTNERGPQGQFGAPSERGPRPPFGSTNERDPQGQFGAPSERGPRPPFGSTNERGPQGQFGAPSERGPRPPFGSTNERGPRPPFGSTNERDPQGPFGSTNERGPRPPFGSTNERGPQGQFGAPSERGPRPPFGSMNERGPRPPFGSMNERGPRPPFGSTNERGPQGQFGAPSERPRPPFGSMNERGPQGKFGEPSERGPRAPAPTVQSPPAVNRPEQQSNDGPRQARHEPRTIDNERRERERFRRERSRERREPRRPRRSRSPVRSTSSATRKRSDDRSNRKRERSTSRSRRDRERRRSRSAERIRNSDSKKTSSITTSDSKKPSITTSDSKKPSSTTSAASGSKPEIKVATDSVSTLKSDSSKSASNVPSGKGDQHSPNSTAAKAMDKEKDVKDKSSTLNASSNPDKADQSKSKDADSSSHKPRSSDDPKSENTDKKRGDKAATGNKETEKKQEKQTTDRDDSRKKDDSSKPRRSRWQASEETPRSNQSSSTSKPAEPQKVSPRKLPGFVSRDRAERPHHPEPPAPAPKSLMGPRPRMMMRPLHPKGATMPRFSAPGPRMHMNHGHGLMPLPQHVVDHHHQHHDENYDEEFYGEEEENFEEEYFDEYAGDWEEPQQQHAAWRQPHPMMHPRGHPMMRPRPPIRMRPDIRHRMHGMPPHPRFPMRPQVPRMGMRMMRPTRPMFRPPHMTHH